MLPKKSKEADVNSDAVSTDDLVVHRTEPKLRINTYVSVACQKCET